MNNKDGVKYGFIVVGKTDFALYYLYIIKIFL